MAEKFYPTRHTTIGAVIDAGLAIQAVCMRCGHSENVDLSEAARRLGRDHSSLPVHLVSRLVCSQCGSKNVATVLAPAGTTPTTDQKTHVRRRAGPRLPEK